MRFYGKLHVDVLQEQLIFALQQMKLILLAQ